ncbi:organic cation transporter protein-like [Diprion similis]|uniref:organic cation transporter protein-like n=1 Tax=Diprion similis TaxID=362088 RepID=UPI001EF773B2|nr:organic cation transporter protein-like [Diprion similis]
MGYDDVISHIREIGPYQRRIFVVNFLPALTSAFHVMGGVFLGGVPEFRCLTPEEDQRNATYDLRPDTANITHPWVDATQSWSRCERYNTTQIDLYQLRSGNSSSKPAAVKCDSFAYDDSQYGVTASTQWDLVCDDAWLKTASESLFMLGVMLGVLTFGALSDRYGRKRMLIWGSILQLISGLLVAASPNFTMYVIFRVLVATTSTGLYVVAYVAAIEMVYRKKKIPAGTISLFFIGGCLLTVVFAYFIRNWRILQLAYTAPTLLFLALSWSIPESARWLLSKGRVEEAKNILHKASMENGVVLPRDALDELLTIESGNKANSGKSSLLDILRYPNIRKRSLILATIWLLNNCTYYGLSWNTANLGGSVHVNSAIVALVELPAVAFLMFTVDKCRRKVVVGGCMTLSSISLLSTTLIPTDMTWLVTGLAMAGKLTITVSYSTLYVFTSEQYPTELRNVGVGTCSAIARLGGVVAPMIIKLSDISALLPLVTFGCSLVLAVLLLVFLPETAKKKLPETIEEVERFGKRKSKSERANHFLNGVNNTQMLQKLKN